MKFLTFVSFFGLAFYHGDAKLPLFDCGEGKVPSSELSVCIEPDYVEGCESYLNES